MKFAIELLEDFALSKPALAPRVNFSHATPLKIVAARWPGIGADARPPLLGDDRLALRLDLWVLLLHAGYAIDEST